MTSEDKSQTTSEVDQLSLTCFHASFFPFCPLAGHPSSSLFLCTFSPIYPPRKVLCSVEQSSQHSACRGAVSGWTSPQSPGRKFLPEICVKKGQVLHARALSEEHTALVARPLGLGILFRPLPDTWLFGSARPLLSTMEVQRTVCKCARTD